jgi:hypothetical protein
MLVLAKLVGTHLWNNVRVIGRIDGGIGKPTNYFVFVVDKMLCHKHAVVQKK